MKKVHPVATRLGRQLFEARSQRNWRLSEMSTRTGRPPARLSEMETGKANSTLDSLAEAGDALGLELMFVPKERVEQVLALISNRSAARPTAYDVPSVFDEVFTPDEENEDEEEETHRAGS